MDGSSYWLQVLSLLVGQLQWLKRCSGTFTGYLSDAYRVSYRLFKRYLQGIRGHRPYRVLIVGLQRLYLVFSGVLNANPKKSTLV